MTNKLNIMNFFKKVKYRLSGAYPFSVSLKNSSVELSKYGVLQNSIKLDSVNKIIAYRDDRLTYAPVTLQLKAKSVDSLSFDELCSGFSEVKKNIEKEFCGIEKDWFNDIDKGDAFGSNLKVLWENK